MTAKLIDWTKLHGEIIDFNLWLEQKNDRCLDNHEAKLILEQNELDPTLLEKMKPGQLIILNHSKQVRAICKDTISDFRYISKLAETKKPSA